MNPSFISNPDGKSTQKLLLFWAVGASVAAALFLGLLLLRQSRVVQQSQPELAESATKPAESIAQPAEVWTSLASLSPAAHAAEGFDLFFKKKDYPGAIAVFEACVLEHPDYADAYHGLAMAQREAGDPAGALPNHDRSIELSPERADYYRVRGITYQRLNNHDAALKSYEQGLQARDTRYCAPGFLQIGLAQCYRANGDLQKALEYNEHAIALDSENQWFYLERGYTYKALGERERAEADFAKGGASRSSRQTRPR